MPNLESFDRSVATGSHEHLQKASPAIAFAAQAQSLAQYTHEQEQDHGTALGSTQAVEAKFITAQDPVIVTANGGRLPAVPIDEALKLNQLRDRLEDRETNGEIPVPSSTRKAKDGTLHGLYRGSGRRSKASSTRSRRGEEPEAPLREAVPPSQTNPLFPPLPTYGPPGAIRTLQCMFFRCTSAVLSLCFLLIIVLGAGFTGIPSIFRQLRMRMTLRDPYRNRPFHEEEVKRRKARRETDHKWQEKLKKYKEASVSDPEKIEVEALDNQFVPTEGGPDPLVCDVGYYARRVGLDVETFDVETEDGFIIELWHVFNPREYRPPPKSAHEPLGPNAFEALRSDLGEGQAEQQYTSGNKKYPILMIHGLLQSAGAYCCNDEDSLAFYLAKSGYDVWLGNNRCGFKPRHVLLDYADPRMWAWNIRQMGVMDLPALISRVLSETGFPKIGLVCHSQGTTQTLVALAKEQRPEIGEKISVFCALAPAAYAGPLIGKAYFKFMYIITPAMFRCIFGIHAFIPFMMQMHKILPAGFYGSMGYHVFSFLFSWTDTRWERDLRDRMFQFAPVYVSSESMRWWLGRECFARHKCILATREEWMMEDEEDEEEDTVIQKYYEGHATDSERAIDDQDRQAVGGKVEKLPSHDPSERGQFAWYNEQFPPIALWVCGNDDLVDGRRLLRRFDRGREPHVKVVHKKIIEGYEHLDVIWAMDAIEKVGREVKEVIWRTAPEASRAICRTPVGCEEIVEFEDKKDNQSVAGSNNASKRDSATPCMNSKRNSSEMQIDAGMANGNLSNGMQSPVSPTQIDATAGEWSTKIHQDEKMND